jgi:hypothetical protein
MLKVRQFVLRENKNTTIVMGEFLQSDLPEIREIVKTRFQKAVSTMQ